MSRILIAATALTGLMLVGACSNKSDSTADAASSAPAASADASTVPGANATQSAHAQAGAAAATPDLPELAIIIPPKPKPGAPHGPGFDMPLLDLGGYPLQRPMEALKDAHIFTADHPEVASYIPCYCGCGSAGHKNNADCFVASRDKEGKVTAWAPHGVGCAVCIDIAVESMRMRNSGASVSAIRLQIQSEYRPHFPQTETPTPLPPAGQ